MASWSSYFHSYARKSRAIGLGVTLALAGFAIVAPGGCALDRQGALGGGGTASMSSTTATTTSATTTSTSTGTIACTSDADCGAPTFDGCTVPTCVASMCTTKSTAGMMSATQTPNDCNTSICGPDGKPMLTPDPNDKPVDDLNPCTDELCVNGAPATMPVAQGTVCPGGLCDGAGVCIYCTKNSDCTGVNATCVMATHTCISCSDGVKNGSETGMDCGGNCKGCSGDACGTDDSACVSNHCTDGVCCDTDCSGICQACNVPTSPGVCSYVLIGSTDPSTCANPMSQACNGVGACKKVSGLPCGQASDCASNVCFVGICRVQTGGDCMDNVACENGLCTGGKCADCSAGNQCTSAVCTAPTCKAPGGAPCAANGDCAGNKCQFGLCLLDNNSACSKNAECRSGFCNPNVNNGTCSPCVNNSSCSGNGSCGNSYFGANSCYLPSGSYCITDTQCVGNPQKCLGFPGKCK